MLLSDKERTIIKKALIKKQKVEIELINGKIRVLCGQYSFTDNTSWTELLITEYGTFMKL